MTDFCDSDLNIYLRLGIANLVSSPFYPKNYPNNIDCFWFVSANTHYIIITVLHLEINEDIVRFGTGNETNPDYVVMEVTGYNVKPNSLIIDFTLCWINMKTDEELSYRGFRLKVETSNTYGIFVHLCIVL